MFRKRKDAAERNRFAMKNKSFDNDKEKKWMKVIYYFFVLFY